MTTLCTGWYVLTPEKTLPDRPLPHCTDCKLYLQHLQAQQYDSDDSLWYIAPEPHPCPNREDA